MKPKHLSSSIYLDIISEFIDVLPNNEFSLDEILSHMAQVVLAPLNVQSILIRQLNNENQALLVATWGMSLENSQQYPLAYSLNDKYPTTDTLRFRRTTWVSTLPDWGVEYPLLKELQYSSGEKSYICIPIEKAGTPVAALGILSRDVIHPDAEIEAFLKTVGSVFSMHLFRQDSKANELLGMGERQNSSDVENTDSELTERQHIILRLISEDRTNLGISELLGYSESTVRQETIKIYAKLVCAGRKEATEIYRQHFAHNQEKNL